jgi:hypothetical protein
MTARGHLSDAALVVLARRREPRAREAHHLERCDRCTRVYAGFRALRETANDVTVAPERSVLAAVFSLAEPLPSFRRDAHRVPLARLLHDSGPVRAAQGLRAGGGMREQLWRIPGADVDVRIQPEGLGSPGVLHGQLFPLRRGVVALADGGVWLTQKGRRAAWSPLDEHGEFELPAPAASRWALWLEWRGKRARLEIH